MEKTFFTVIKLLRKMILPNVSCFVCLFPAVKSWQCQRNKVHLIILYFPWSQQSIEKNGRTSQELCLWEYIEDELYSASEQFMSKFMPYI